MSEGPRSLRSVHAFNRQIAIFRIAAKLTQNRYGTSSHPAAREILQNVIPVTMIASQSATMSTMAKPGIRPPKKMADQRTLSASWTANHRKPRRVVSTPLRQTSHVAIAIMAYNIVHTGPKTRAGGVYGGLANAGCQVLTDVAVNTEPRPAARNTPTKKAASPIARQVGLGRVVDSRMTYFRTLV
jgi:hypothetical protein